MAAHVAEAAPAASAPPLIARRAPGLASPLVPMLMATEVAGTAPAPRAALLTAAAAPAAAFVGFGERGAGLGARGSVVSSAREVASLDAFTAPQLALIPPPLPPPASSARPASLAAQGAPPHPGEQPRPPSCPGRHCPARLRAPPGRGPAPSQLAPFQLAPFEPPQSGALDRLLPELQRLSNEEVGRDMMGRDMMGRPVVCAPEATALTLSAPPPPVEVAHEADGLRLHLSAKSATGYAAPHAPPTGLAPQPPTPPPPHPTPLPSRPHPPHSPPDHSPPHRPAMAATRASSTAHR